MFSTTKYIILANSQTSCLIPTPWTSAGLAVEQKFLFVVLPLGKITGSLV